MSKPDRLRLFGRMQEHVIAECKLIEEREWEAQRAKAIAFAKASREQNFRRQVILEKKIQARAWDW